jgi:hypothetical protein
MEPDNENETRTEVEQQPEEGEKEEKGPEQSPDLSSSRKPNWVEKAGVLLGLASLIAGIALGVDAHSNGQAAPGKAPAELTLVDMLVRDIDVTPRHAQLEIVLHNTGDQLVVIDQARIRIRHVYRLLRCATQGDLPLSNTYGVLLPIDAKPNEVIGTPLHQQVGPVSTTGRARPSSCSVTMNQGKTSRRANAGAKRCLAGAPIRPSCAGSSTDPARVPLGFTRSRPGW